MKFLQCISFLSIVWLASVSSLSVQLEDTQLPPSPPRRTIAALEQMSLRVENWDSKDVAHSVIEPGEQMLRVVRRTSFFSYLGASKMRVVMCSLMFTLLVMALLLAPWTCFRSNADHDLSEAWRAKQGRSNADHDLSEFSADAHPDLTVSAEIGDGSWAHTYRLSKGEQKDALELLYRCKIVSAQEFTHSSASQEHIEECIWIATQMLRQKPLEEWVKKRQQALQSFEDSITAIFASRATAGYGPDSLHKELLGNSRTKGEDTGPTGSLTPPLQDALKDLLILKGSFPAPVMCSRSGASTVQASPVTPGRLPGLLAQHSRGSPLDDEDVDLTFETPVRGTRPNPEEPATTSSEPPKGLV